MTPLERAARALFDLTVADMGQDAGGPDSIEEQWARSKERYIERALADDQVIDHFKRDCSVPGSPIEAKMGKK